MTHEHAPITHHLLRAKTTRAGRPALRFKRHRGWLELTWDEYYARVEAAGLGLAALGVKRGDRVAILANSRLEWAVLDFAVMSIGGVTVPVYPTSTPAEVEAIVQHAGASALIVENAAQLAKWTAVRKRCPNVEILVCLEPGPDVDEDTLDWDDLLNCGLEMYAQKPAFFANELGQVHPGDLATIVYTSGTTGRPKGVCLSHRQVMSEVTDLLRAFPIGPKDSTLSFLPYAHVLGRTEVWLHTYVGFLMSFSEGAERLRRNLGETKPTVIIGVPRVFEKMREAVWTSLGARPVVRTAARWLTDDHARGPRHHLADVLIYRRLRAALGGRLRFVVSGGAPLDADLAHFFARAGILILEGYGLTETTGAITVNTPAAYEFGTVGRPLADVELKIAADGEILVRSGKLFLAYHGDPEGTAAALEDGFFKTGDVGEVNARGFLTLTDRKKDLIKTAGGKFVAPQKLEALLKRDPLVSNVLIHGDRRKYVVALITLDETALVGLARENGWSYRDYRALSQTPAVRELIEHLVTRVNADLASFESIKRFTILPRDFELERGEVTPSLKIKRRVLDETFKSELNALYAEPYPSRSGPAARP